MARGGARLGSGPKPRRGRVLDMPGVPPRSTSKEQDAAALAQLLEPGAHLTEDEQALWRRLAPLVQQRGMLTAETVPGLEHLCEVSVTYTKLRKILDDEGWQITLYEDVDGHKFPMEQKRHPLWPQFQAFAVRREQALRAFGLIASGSPVPTFGRAAKDDNPWTTLERNREGR